MEEDSTNFVNTRSKNVVNCDVRLGMSFEDLKNIINSFNVEVDYNRLMGQLCNREEINGIFYKQGIKDAYSQIKNIISLERSEDDGWEKDPDLILRQIYKYVSERA